MHHSREISFKQLVEKTEDPTQLLFYVLLGLSISNKLCMIWEEYKFDATSSIQVVGDGYPKIHKDKFIDG